MHFHAKVTHPNSRTERRSVARMGLILLVFATLILVPHAAIFAQATSSPAAPSSSAEDNVSSASTDLPVSVERIREELLKTPVKPLIRGLNEQPTFTSGVEERLTLEDFFRPEDFAVGPVPPGGLYAYEMQQVVSNPVSRPLAQPYAAFSGGELATIAIENLIFKYLGSRLTRAFANSREAAAQAAAEAEVAGAIAEYCAAQPDGGSHIGICRNQRAPR